MRSVVVAIALVLGLTGTAEARRAIVVVTSGSDYVHVRDLSPAEAEGEAGWMIGYRYDYWGLFWIDFSRSSGEFILYRDDETYLPLTDQKAAQLGASVPWKYWIPLGWIILVALIEAALVIWGLDPKQHRRHILGFGIAMSVLSLVFFLIGLRPEFVIPLVLALQHLGSLAIRRYSVDAADATVDPGPDEPPAERKFVDDAPLPSPPRLDDDPFRAPPMARPIVAEKPPERPSTAPIVHDANADQPKLLR